MALTHVGMREGSREGVREGNVQGTREGRTTRTIEEQTARIPSLGYLGFALGSMAVSASLAFILNRRDWANFVGLWAPSILIIGLYNKVVKIQDEILEPGRVQNLRPAA